MVTQKRERHKQALASIEPTSEARLKEIIRWSRVVFYSCEATADCRYSFISENIRDLIGYEAAELMDDPALWVGLIHPEDLERVQDGLAAAPADAPTWIEYRVRRKNGGHRWIGDELRPITGGDGRIIEYVGTRRDITGKREAEEALNQSLDSLKGELKERAVELKRKQEKLEDVNTALKILLKQREEDKAKLEEAVLSNVKNLIEPCLEKLMKSNVSSDQMSYLEILKSHIEEITSPFIRNLSNCFLGLTPMEIQVASLIRKGRNTKEIAQLLYISENAVLFHRHNIRSKLGLKSKKINLSSYLQTLKE